MTILLKKTRGLLATILCIILLAANVLLVSADSEGDVYKRQDFMGADIGKGMHKKYFAAYKRCFDSQ